VGLVDGIRIGNDVGTEWKGSLSVQSLLRDLPTRNFANHILWQIDPDSILLREHYHNLTSLEVRSLAIFAGMSGGVIMTGDDLQEFSEEQLRLWKLILNTKRSTCRFPLLGESPVILSSIPSGTSDTSSDLQPLDPVIVAVRNSIPSAACAIFIFNTGEHPVQRTYSLSALGMNSPCYVYDWTGMHFWADPVEQISVTLSPHDSALLFLASSPIAIPPTVLP
jgi:hypothetical protein